MFVSRGNFILFSVDYRLAPEYPFPTAPNDCYDALQWVFNNAKEYGGDPNKITLAGLSAGGNLAAVVSLMSTAQGGPKISKQILEVPGMSFLVDDESSINQVHALLWNTEIQLFARSIYLPNATDWFDYRASPVLAPAELVPKQPETLILVCTEDPLYSGGVAWHKRLLKNGVKSELVTFEGIPHAGYRLPYPFYTAERAIFETRVLQFLNKQCSI